MTRFVTIFLATLLVAGASLGRPLAQPTNPPPTTPAPASGESDNRWDIAAIEAQLQSVTNQADLDESVRTQAADLYRQAKAHLESTTAFSQKLEQLRETTRRLPEDIQRLRTELDAPPKAGITNEIASIQNVDEITARTTRAQADLSAVNQELQTVENDIAGRAAVLEALRQRQGVIQQAIAARQSPSAETPGSTPPHPAVASAQTLVRQLSGRDLVTESQWIELRLNIADTRSQWLNLSRDVQRQRKARLETELALLDKRLKEIERAETERVRREAEAEERRATFKHPLLRKVTEQNTGFADERVRLVGSPDKPGWLDDLEADRKSVETSRTSLAKDFSEAKAQIEEIGLNLAFGELIREQRNQLPELLDETQERAGLWRERFAESAPRRLLIDREQRRAEDVETYLETWITKNRTPDMPPLSEAQRTEIRSYLVNRQDLLSKLSQSYQDFLTLLRKYQFEQQGLETVISDYENFLSEWLLWIPSEPFFRPQLVLDAMPALKGFVSSENVTDFYWNAWNGLRSDGPIVALAILPAIAALVFARRLRNKQAEWNTLVGKVQSDRIGLTFQTLLVSLVRACPAPIGLAAAAWLVRQAETSEFTQAVSQGLWIAAQAVLLTRFFQVLCSPGGVAEVHFRWRESTLKAWRRHLRWLVIVLPVTAGLTAVTQAQSTPEIQGAIGRLPFVAWMLSFTIFVAGVLRPATGIFSNWLERNPRGWASRLRFLWFGAAVLVPVFFAWLALSGYFYAALELQTRLRNTIAWIAATTILHAICVRWLLITARRMALAQARERREALRREAGTDAPQKPEEEPRLDIMTINDQSRQLLSTVLGTLVIVGLYLIWADVLPAFRILQEIKIGETVVQTGTETVVQPVTLVNLATSIIAIVLTIAAARNIPGVLEVAVLRNLPLDSGSRYAITTISQYVLASIGIAVAFKSFGLRWSQVQWLVAALSVGLGFGLQEIFANFVSGIIILFERPIRVGDIVKVGDVMGTVSRIRIRATTINNWDRQEYVVPNKEIITGKLFNWTLSDTTNRIVVEVGIAYGSDTDRARSILQEIVATHPRLTRDPAPVVTFEGFGDSALNFVVRCYLPDFENRLETVHQLHTAIHRRFAEAGIEIAFPQRDIHIRSIQPPDRWPAITGSTPPPTAPPAAPDSTPA